MDYSMVSFVILADPERINPKMHKVIEGRNASFTCYSSDKIYWYYEDEVFPYSVGSTVHIPIVKINSGGYYECVSTTKVGVTFRARALLIVLCKGC